MNLELKPTHENIIKTINEDVLQRNDILKMLKDGIEKEKIMELFSEECINMYKPFFNNTKVIREAEKIFDAVKSADELNNEEKIASAILSYLILREYYEKNDNI